MDIFLFVLVFAIVSFILLRLAKAVEDAYSIYDTSFVRGDVRCIMGKITYNSTIEEKRQQLNKYSSKF